VSAFEINYPAIEAFCLRWKVLEFSLFGSILREDFSPDSDVDVLVKLPEESGLSLFDWLDMIDELKGIFGREVDLIEETGLLNPIRREAILSTRRILYAG
jgi:predicted nucleotidyltransferase